MAGAAKQTIAAPWMLRRSIRNASARPAGGEILSQIFAPAAFSAISMLCQGQIGYGPGHSLNAP
jgi:hypothetical protein